MEIWNKTKIAENITGRKHLERVQSNSEVKDPSTKQVIKDLLPETLTVSIDVSCLRSISSLFHFISRVVDLSYEEG